jgi:hypothetical protein
MELAIVHWQGLLVWAKVVMQLVQKQAGWVLVQAQVLREEGLVLVQAQEGQVVVREEKLRGQDHNRWDSRLVVVSHTTAGDGST